MPFMRDVFDGLLMQQDGRFRLRRTRSRDDRLISVQRIESLRLGIRDVAQGIDHRGGLRLKPFRGRLLNS